MSNLRIAIVVSSIANKEFSSTIGSLILAENQNVYPNVTFDVVNFDDYPLPLFDQADEVLRDHWPVTPSNTAALDWIRRIASYDGYFFIANGACSYDLIFNGLDFVADELAYKPADLIHIDDLEVTGVIDSLRLRLIEKQSICLWNGFEITEAYLDSQRVFDDFFPKDLSEKINQLFSDLVRIAGAVKAAR